VVARKAMWAEPQRFRSPGESMEEIEKRDQDACLPISDEWRAGSWQRRCRGACKRHIKIPNMQAHYQKTGKREVDLTT
jgi:hypothetical protein